VGSGGDTHDVVVGGEMEEYCGCTRLVRYVWLEERRMAGCLSLVLRAGVFLSVSVWKDVGL
jgi:hypothetical protein